MGNGSGEAESGLFQGYPEEGVVRPAGCRELSRGSYSVFPVCGCSSKRALLPCSLFSEGEKRVEGAEHRHKVTGR